MYFDAQNLYPYPYSPLSGSATPPPLVLNAMQVSSKHQRARYFWEIARGDKLVKFFHLKFESLHDFETRHSQVLLLEIDKWLFFLVIFNGHKWSFILKSSTLGL